MFNGALWHSRRSVGINTSLIASGQRPHTHSFGSVSPLPSRETQSQSLFVRLSVATFRLKRTRAWSSLVEFHRSPVNEQQCHIWHIRLSRLCLWTLSIALFACCFLTVGQQYRELRQKKKHRASSLCLTSSSWLISPREDPGTLSW